MTPRERAKIYRRAAERVFYAGGHKFCCTAVYEVANDFHFEDLLQLFPELKMFKPDKLIAESPFESLWWPSAEIDSRINCLLFCERLALDAA